MPRSFRISEAVPAVITPPEAALTDREILAAVIGDDNAATEIAKAFSLTDLARADVPTLARVPGMTRMRAARLVAAIEIGKRVASASAMRDGRIGTSRDVFDRYRPRLAHLLQEVFVVVALDARQRVLADFTVGMGTATTCPISPADAVRPLIKIAASGCVFIHNHPSGDPTPSRDDVVLTERLRAACELLGIRMIDHVVVGSEGYFSFCDGGMKPAASMAAERSP